MVSLKGELSEPFEIWNEVNQGCILFLSIILSDDFTDSTQVRGPLNKFPDFFRMGTFIDSSHMKLYPLRRNLLRQQCTFSTVPTASGRLHGCPLV